MGRTEFFITFIRNQHFHFVLLLFLLKHGDVERNPGPEVTHNEFSMSILHCNIRSNRRKLDYIKDSFMDFDFSCFTETHLDKTGSDEFLHLSEALTPFTERFCRTNQGGGIVFFFCFVFLIE